MIIVMIGWVFFASADFGSAFGYLGCMINITNIGFGDNMFFYRLSSYLVVMVVAIIGATPLPSRYFTKLTASDKYYWLKPVLSFVCLILCTAYLIDNTYNPFLYFRF